MKLILILLSIISVLYPQTDPDIREYLRKIENGKAAEVEKQLPDLKIKYPGSFSVMYLEGILEENGESAVKLFSAILEKAPNSLYADASAYRLYSYYKASENSSFAAKYYDLLKKNYPASPYVKYLPADLKQGNTEGTNYNYTVQAGAFSNAMNAENLRKKFVKAGYHTYVKDKIIGGTVFKIVYTGKFKNRREAEDFQVILDREYGLKGLVTRYQE